MSLSLDYKDKITRVYYVFSVIMIMSFMFYMEHNTPISFDAGMNFTVSRSINLYGQYAADYHGQHLFEEHVQTGAPVIFATSILNQIIGISPSNMQIVTTFFGACLLIFISVVLVKKTSICASFLCTIFILTMPAFLNVSYLGYGETSTGMFLFLVCLMFSSAEENDRKLYYYFSGLCMGLAYLTKTVALIICPVIAIIMLVRLIQKRTKISRYLVFAFGAITPVIIFEIYKLFQLGLNRYWAWWKNMLDSIFGQAGLTDKYTGGDKSGIDKITLHIETLCNQNNINIYILISIIIIPLIVVVVKLVKKEKVDVLFYMSYGIFLIYFMWWSILSPTAKLWPRRILIGMVMGIFVFVWSCHILIDQINTSRKLGIMAKCVIIVILMVVFGRIAVVNCNNSITENKNYKQAYPKLVEAIEFIDSLPEESIFYGVEWLQNPIIAGMGNISMRDISQEMPSRNKAYYVQENLTSEWVRVTNNYVLSQYETELVFENACSRIYKIIDRKDYNDIEKGIEVSLAESNECTITFYTAAENESYSEDRRTTAHIHEEDKAVLGVNTDDIKQLMLVITYAENKEQELVIKGIKIKTAQMEMSLSPQEIYSRIMDSDENKKNYMSFDESGNLQIKITTRWLTSIDLR